MTSNIDAVSRIPLRDSADREKLSLLPWFLIALVFAVAILLRQVVPLNTDVSWLLTVGERVLDGERLYVDIVEINPPMSVLAYLPGIVLARALGLDPKYVIDTQILLLAAASLLVTARILRLSSMLDKVRWASLAIWAAAVLTILPMHVFGQREHIATLTFLPALAVYALRSNREPLPLWAILTAGVGAGITLAFKPYFAIPAILCVVMSAVRAHSWRVLFSPENVIAGGLVTAFSFYTYVFYPEYFTATYPLVRDIYLSWSMPASVVLLNSATLIWLIAVISIFLVRRTNELDSAALVTLLASFGFAISFFLQGRGWAYQSYPMVALVLLGMGYVLTGAASIQAGSRRFEIAAMSMLAATFVVGSQWFNAQVYVGPIEGAVAALKPHPRILVLSGEAAIGHPLVRTLHGVWVSRQESLWAREFVRLTREHNSIDPQTDARLNGYLAQERTWLIEDFKSLPPDVVLIDNLRDGWGAWARADAELTQLLRPYTLVQSIEGIDILRRTER
ncbi:hypothetical protein [Bradyrhizobium canariense]|uniref:Glycosyltransferase RgtA/B/C/D-like domain-containing protein n=1 Tax=Bradyrhizobium canariense TaxID=255045 RepID=A0A1H1YZH2_9BRAD|nr:hypothetical protein [Bradyrhizobium canariense]SDT26955.1 hypothetical protein SAMN05444158_5115 [Bradyrhizobium canariense]